MQTFGVTMPSKKIMERLAAAAQELNRESEDLDEVIEGFEDDLARIGVGLTCWLGADLIDPATYLLEASTRREDEDVSTASGWLLGYTKHEGKWRLVVKRAGVRIDAHPATPRDEGQTLVDEDGAQTPLLKAPRSVRVEAVAALEQLADQIASKLASRAKAIRDAKRVFAEDLAEKCRELGYRGKVEVSDMRMVKDDLPPDVLFVWRARDGFGVGLGADSKAALRQAQSMIGKYFGRYGGRSAMGDTLEQLLANLGVKTQSAS
jgi:hypothetical protein